MPGPDYIEKVLVHARTFKYTAQLINTVGTYMGAPDGSDEEQTAGNELMVVLDQVRTLPIGEHRDLIMSIVTLLVTFSDADELQKWFDNAHAWIEEGLNG